MSELLFEGYGVTSVTYGLDSLFSFHANASSPTLDGLVISSATANTHIIPVVGGVAMLNRAKK
jgi:actin-related protein 5